MLKMKIDEKIYFCVKNCDIQEHDIITSDEALENTGITELDVNNNRIECDSFNILADSLKDCIDLKNLMSQITILNLSNNQIEFHGIKYLADALKDTQIVELNLSKNNIQDDGIKYLADVLNKTKIEHLDLTENKISFEAAEYFNKSVSNTALKSLFLEIHYGEFEDNCVYQRSYSNLNEPYIKIYGTGIGISGMNYINRSFCETGIAELELQYYYFDEEDINQLHEAFKYIKISKLKAPIYFTESYLVEYLIRIFEKSRIGLLDLACSKFRNSMIRHLVKFLRKIKVLSLDVSFNHLENDSIQHLSPVLRNSNIMSLNLEECDVTSEGAKYLSEILRDSKIVNINLCRCNIGPRGAIYLANGLRYSQVTDINLYGNIIRYAGYRALNEVVNDTNITWVNLHANDIEADMVGEKLWPYGIPRNNTTVASKIRNSFGKLVSLKPDGSGFEFIVPTKKDACDFLMDFSRYVFLIETLKNNPNTKVHIIYEMYKKENNIYDFTMMKKIDKFVDNIMDEFNWFFNTKLTDLLIEYPKVDYVDIVKQFEELEFDDIVTNLLLHRVLYYVDDNQEILHPYIYKLLIKYYLPLYNSELEPSKRNQIIVYYENNQEIDGVQEIIDLLK